MADILRPDQGRMRQIFGPVLFLRIETAAEHRIERHAAVFLPQIGQMRHQIVVKGLRRTVAETAAVGQQTDFFVMRLSPGADFPERSEVIIDVPLNAESVESFLRITECFERAEFHIDRGADLQPGKMFFQGLRDKPRGGGDRIQPDLFQDISRNAHRAVLKAFADALRPQTIRIEEQVQCNAHFPGCREVFQQDAFSLVFGQSRGRGGGGPGAPFIAGREIEFRHVLRIILQQLRKTFRVLLVRILIADGKFHFSPVSILYAV